MRIAAIAILLALTASAQAKIAAQDWGTGPDGGKVSLYTLTNAKGIEARITNYGGVITSIRAPGRDGTFADVVQGFDSLSHYTDPDYAGRYGSIPGRFANRIKDSLYVLNGVTYHVTRDGKPYDQRTWLATPSDGAEPKLILKLTDPDGTMGFPGTAHVTVTYTLTNRNALRIDYRATTDKPTVMSLTNHSYFNLAGGGTVLDQLLTVNADNMTPSDDTNTPTGELRAVSGTAFDLRTPTPIGAHIGDADPLLVRSKGYDHNFAINGAPGRLRLAARLEDSKSGRVMEEWSTQAGLQVYTANSVRPKVTAEKGWLPHGAVALEAQAFPNAPNIPSFPSAVVTPEKPLHEITEFRFLVAK